MRDITSFVNLKEQIYLAVVKHVAVREHPVMNFRLSYCILKFKNEVNLSEEYLA